MTPDETKAITSISVDEEEITLVAGQQAPYTVTLILEPSSVNAENCKIDVVIPYPENLSITRNQSIGNRITYLLLPLGEAFDQRVQFAANGKEATIQVLVNE